MPKIILADPKKERVLVFDATGSDTMAGMVLNGIDHGVLHARREVFYLTWPILWGVLKNLKYLGRDVVVMLKSDGAEGLGMAGRCRRFLGGFIAGLNRIYLLSCIEWIRPFVVVTLIDNSYDFQWISRVYRGAFFVAIQNGMRIRSCLKDSLNGRVISMPVLICFGEHDVNLFRKYGHQIDAYYPAGSLKARYFHDALSVKGRQPEFELCLLSAWVEYILTEKELSPICRGILKLDELLARYVRESGATLCIALRSTDKKERDYFLRTYGAGVHFVDSDAAVFSSYNAADRSEVTVSCFSTLDREVFGWGAKVFCCNFSGDDQYDFPCPGFWSMNVPDYGLFKAGLDHVRRMDIDSYRRQIKDNARYIMNNDARTPQEIVRELIFETLEGKGDGRIH
ncbi:MAG: hypothetical protein WCI27_07985 [Candidatus Omnitrophota bacterium]